METLAEILEKAIANLGYKVKASTDGEFVIRYQMHYIHIYYSENAPKDVIVLMGSMCEVSDENIITCLKNCNELNNKLKHYKYYIWNDDLVATIEFCFKEMDDLVFQLRNAVHNISQAKNLYDKNI